MEPVYPFTQEQARGYLAAMIDGEGNINYAGRNRTIGIANTDLGIHAAIAASCDVLGIEHRLWEDKARQKMRQRKRCWYTFIRKRSSLEFIYREIPLQSATKREQLGALLLSYRRPRAPSAQLLQRLYWDENMTAREISDLLGFPKSTSGVYHMMRRHSIARRPATVRPKADAS